MPNARTHDVITVVTGVMLVPISYSILLNQGAGTEEATRNTALLVGAHLLSGIMFSPDLDIDSAIDNRWGIFYWLWRPYMWLTPHRRWFSHGLILSPLLRLLYLGGVLTLLFMSFAWMLGQFGILVPDYHVQAARYLLTLIYRYPGAVLFLIIGFITGSAAHTIADWLVTGGKRYLQRLGFRITRNYRNHDYR
jgi:uncharacterized metal-binding protein